MKEKIQKRFDLNPKYVYNTTEEQIMKALGYARYWDSGKIKWIYNTEENL